MLDKSKIMKTAWATFKMWGSAIRAVHGGSAAAFSIALRRAWADAKMEAAKAPIAPMSLDDIKYAITVLENKDRWTAADHKRRGELSQMQRAA